MRDRVSKRKTRYRLRLRVEAIEAARREAGWTQEEFAELGEFGVGRYREVLRETRKGGFPEFRVSLLAGILSVLDWTTDEAIDQVVTRK